MKKMWIVLCVLAMVSLSAWAQTGAPEKAPAPPSVQNVVPPVAAVNHIIKATYINTCLPSCPVFAIGAGAIVPLDAVTTINCPAPIGKTCTITDDAWLELQNTSATTNNPETLELFVDGVLIDGYYDGGGGTPGGFFFDALAEKTAVATTVSRGLHTVQTQTDSLDGANGAAWTATYRVYVP